MTTKLNFENKSFLDLRALIDSVSKNENQLIDSSAPSQKGDLMVPSIYLKANGYFECDENLVQQGLMLTIFSFKSHFDICVEYVESPFVQYYNVLDSKFLSLLKIPRDKILDFKIGDVISVKGLKPKKTFQFMKNLGPAAAMGGLITGLIQRKIIKAAANLEDDTMELKVSIFDLNFKNSEGNIVCLSIVCERFYEDEFEYFLKKQWINAIPEIPKEPKTKAERVRAYGELFKVNDKVRVARFFTYDYGIIVSKESEHASVLVNKNGTEAIERINYWKLKKVKE
jgi:hypothetical protein